MKVIGFKRADFMSKEGAPISGYNLYLSYPITGEDADGSACERYYMTDAKLARSGYKPHVGDEVNVSYIISDKSEEIARVIMGDLDRSVTYLEGEGGYSIRQQIEVTHPTGKGDFIL